MPIRSETVEDRATEIAVILVHGGEPMSLDVDHYHSVNRLPDVARQLVADPLDAEGESNRGLSPSVGWVIASTPGSQGV
ncbi:hypothetical protein ABIA39_008758 [Nocardia sp. GAS34]